MAARSDTAISLERALADALPGRPLVVVLGPTASGKSALALDLAVDLPVTVVNADSIQVYADLRILSARPGPEDMAVVPHRLFGHMDAAESGSAARWAAEAGAAISESWAAGRLPVAVGGTGLYVRALLEGLSDMPDIPAGIRDGLRNRLAVEGPAALHRDLAARDPATASRLKPGDSQRVLRALEILEATGISLVAWQARPPRPAISARRFVIVLLPPRDVVYRAAETRFDAMIAAGALDEVARLRARGPDPDRPVMRALGVPELAAHLSGEIDLPTAVERAKTATRQYVKRQYTWLRHQVAPDMMLPARYAAESQPEIRARLLEFLLTCRD